MNEIAWCYVEGFGCKKDKVCYTRSHLLMTACLVGSRALCTMSCIEAMAAEMFSVSLGHLIRRDTGSQLTAQLILSESSIDSNRFYTFNDA